MCYHIKGDKYERKASTEAHNPKSIFSPPSPTHNLAIQEVRVWSVTCTVTLVAVVSPSSGKSWANTKQQDRMLPH